jgi:hypothetical protein
MTASLRPRGPRIESTPRGWPPPLLGCPRAGPAFETLTGITPERRARGRRPPPRGDHERGFGSGPAYPRYFKQIAKAVVLPRP